MLPLYCRSLSEGASPIPERWAHVMESKENRVADEARDPPGTRSR